MQLEEIKGLGKSRIRKLQAAGIVRPLDLLLHFPYRYVDLAERPDLNKLQTGDTLTVSGTIVNEPKVQYVRKGLNVVKASVATDCGKIEAAWFNQKFIARSLPQGKTVTLTGKVKRFGNKISINSPVILQPSGTERIIPLYRAVNGVPSKLLREAIEIVLARSSVNGYIPDSVRALHALPSLDDTFRAVHRPRDITEAYRAARALSLEKLGYTLSMFEIVKQTQRKGYKFAYNTGDAAMRAAVQSLPFALTAGQQDALRDILLSLKGEKSMNRMLQGDVGCGKTIVALLSMYYAHLNGYQSVLMAPTEILALQHYRAAIRYLEPMGARAVLLCGSLSKSERDAALFQIRTAAADIVIGTHALLSEDVIFCNPSLLITDEQQRFGVNQRGQLENKAPGADALVMTATPIPRTLALSLYGELEQSYITSMPANRAEVVTSIVPENKFGGMFDYVADKAQKGEQTYIVCPRIEEDEETQLTSAVTLYKMFTRKYPDCVVGLLHGKLKDAEKAAVMQQFASGEIEILVATTVVEVGIDVPNATAIIIFNAERYGLSQLHQLRGRVGRGAVKSYCFLPQTGSGTDPRLRYFCECKDGFALSEYDFNQRGAGDFIGTRQHGDCDDLPVKIDAALIEAAKAICRDTLRNREAYVRLCNALTAGTEQYVRCITMN